MVLLLKGMIEKNSEACAKAGAGQLGRAGIYSQRQAGLPGRTVSHYSPYRSRDEAVIGALDRDSSSVSAS